MTLKRNALGEPIAVEIRCGVTRPNRRRACHHLIAVVSVVFIPRSIMMPSVRLVQPEAFGRIEHDPSLVALQREHPLPQWDGEAFCLALYAPWLTLHPCPQHDGLADPSRRSSVPDGPQYLRRGPHELWATSSGRTPLADLHTRAVLAAYRAWLQTGEVQTLRLSWPGDSPDYQRWLGPGRRGESAADQTPADARLMSTEGLRLHWKVAKEIRGPRGRGMVVRADRAREIHERIERANQRQELLEGFFRDMHERIERAKRAGPTPPPAT